MKVTIENKTLQLEEVFNPIRVKSTNGEILTLSLADGGFEVQYQGKLYGFNEGKVLDYQQLQSDVNKLSEKPEFVDVAQVPSAG